MSLIKSKSGTDNQSSMSFGAAFGAWAVPPCLDLTFICLGRYGSLVPWGLVQMKIPPLLLCRFTVTIYWMICFTRGCVASSSLIVAKCTDSWTHSQRSDIGWMQSLLHFNVCNEHVHVGKASDHKRLNWSNKGSVHWAPTSTAQQGISIHDLHVLYPRANCSIVFHKFWLQLWLQKVICNDRKKAIALGTKRMAAVLQCIMLSFPEKHLFSDTSHNWLCRPTYQSACIERLLGVDQKCRTDPTLLTWDLKTPYVNCLVLHHSKRLTFTLLKRDI